MGMDQIRRVGATMRHIPPSLAASLARAGMGVQVAQAAEVEEAWMRLLGLLADRAPADLESVRSEVNRRLTFHVESTRRTARRVDMAAVIRSAAREVAEGIL